MNTETAPPAQLPEVTQLEKRREWTKNLIDPGILHKDEFLKSEEVVELLKIKEKIGQLGGKMNPVELVTIDNVTDQKARFLEVFGTDDESGVEFRYEQVKEKAADALKEGLVALGHKAEDVEAMSFEDMVSEATTQVGLLQDQIRENRVLIRKNQKAGPSLDEDSVAKDVFRSKMAANIAMQGLVMDLVSTLQLVRGISQNDDRQIAAALGQIYGRTISPELRSAADQYLLEVPDKVKNKFIGNGTSGLTQDEFKVYPFV